MSRVACPRALAIAVAGLIGLVMGSAVAGADEPAEPEPAWETRSAALEVPGVLVLGESRTVGPRVLDGQVVDYGGAYWSAVVLLGTELYGAQAPHHAVPAEPSGELAALAPAVSDLNAVLCPSGGLLPTPVGGCVRLLEADLHTHLTTSRAHGAVATADILSSGGAGGASLLEVASSTVEGDTCDGTTASASLLRPLLGPISKPACSG